VKTTTTTTTITGTTTGLACPIASPDAPCKEFPAQVLTLAAQAKQIHSGNMDLLLGIVEEIDADKVSFNQQVETLRQSFNAKMSRLSDKVHKVIANKSGLIAIWSAISIITGAKFPGVKPAAKVTCFAGLALAMFLTGAGKPDTRREAVSEDVKKTDQSCFDKACLAMVNKQYTSAAALFQDAADAGCDLEMCLNRKAEAQYRLGDDTAALATCDVLEGQRPKSQGAAFVRGLVFKRQGSRGKARMAFEVAALRGHPLARLQLEDLG
jgi:hypothetical protein